MKRPRDRPRRPGASVREHVREHTRAAFRDAILAAAEKVFARCGFAGARMSDVAAEAGLATGTLYNYFDNKDAIFRSLIHEHGTHMMRQLATLCAGSGDALARIRDMVHACFVYLEEHRAAFMVFHELGGISESSIGRIGGAELAERYGEYVALFERAIADAVRARRLRDDIPPGELAAFLTGAMNGVVRSWIVSDTRSRLRDRAELVTGLFFSGASTPT